MSEHDLVFYTNPMSRGRTVRWMLEEVGAPYHSEIVDYGPPMKSEAYTSINPMGKVPALVHRGVVVTEGAAICAYLADAFPEAGLAPEPGSPARGPYMRWLFFGAGPLETATTNAAMGFVTDNPKAFGRLGYGSLEAVAQTLDGALSGGVTHLAGDSFSAADLYVCSQLYFLMSFGLLEKRPSFEAFCEKHLSRPAAVRANEIDGPMS